MSFFLGLFVMVGALVGGVVDNIPLTAAMIPVVEAISQSMLLATGHILLRYA